jgi:uncharacterized membrane protein
VHLITSFTAPSSAHLLASVGVGVGDPSGALDTIFRALHILSGITWIGLLYFFNLVQTPAYAELSDGARSEALRKLTFRALWWFRFAALSTFLFGVLLVGINSNVPKHADPYLSNLTGTAIMTGMLFGITMFLNVWGVIWRNQKVVIANAQTVADGGTPNPEAAGSAKKAARASRANTFMSVTMLWFMVFAAHGNVWFHVDANNHLPSTIGYWVLVLVLWAFIEGSALGFIGGLDSPFNKLAFDKHKNTIWGAFGLVVIVYGIGWGILLKA